MRTTRLGQLIAEKYKIAASMENIEASMRNKIDSLYNVVHNTHNILEWCASSNVKGAVDDNDKKAQLGFRFCHKLVSIIDFLKANKTELSLEDITNALLELTNLIDQNKNIEGSPVQYATVSELIFQGLPSSTKHDRKVRDEQFGKMRNGLARILNIAIDMSKDLKELEPDPDFASKVESPKFPARMEPQRGQLTSYDIIDFVRQYGDEFGISDLDEWRQIVDLDPELREKLTTVINARNRGKISNKDYEVKKEISAIKNRLKELS